MILDILKILEEYSYHVIAKTSNLNIATTFALVRKFTTPHKIRRIDILLFNI